MRLFIKKSDYYIDIDSSITAFEIKDSIIFRELSFNLFNNVELYENDNFINLEKSSTIIYNPFQITLNEKKLLNYLYKDLISKIKDDDRKYFLNIENNFFSLMDDIIENIDYPIEYSDSTDFTKLFQSFDVKFKEGDVDNYLELLVSYLKICNILLKVKYVFSFNLLNLLSKKEQNLLMKELDIIGVILIDFSISSEKDIMLHYVEDDWFTI
ncbi:MAG: type II-A CRISPR-associated protein Csn2 [Clostridia bacterium]|nr:type II-A CRISPR-associated protein Csn2 [Clostridia bacterium]